MRPRRAIRTVLVFALLGVFTTVLTSWVLHGWHYSWRLGQGIHELGGSNLGGDPFDDRTWSRHRLEFDWPPPRPERPRQFLTAEDFQRFGWRRQRAFVGASPPGPSSSWSSWDMLAISEAGWPMPALRQADFRTWNLNSPSPLRELASPAYGVANGIQLWPGPSTQHNSVGRLALPIDPLWPGFLVNACLYGLLLCIAWRSPGAVRRALRRRRGRCVACGYDRAGLGADAPCPECGHTLAA